MDKLYLENDSEKAEVGGSVDPFVEISLKIINALTELSSEHNKNNSSKTNIQHLKKIYLREIDSLPRDSNKNVCALARIIMFLRFKSGEKIFVSKPKKSEDSNQEIKALIFEETTGKKHRNISMFLDISDNWSPSEEDFSKAEQYSEDNNLNFNLRNTEDLYLNEYQPINNMWD